MDWNKHGSKKADTSRRLSIPISEQLNDAILVFKQFHTSVLSDTAVLVTMIEAGFKQWGEERIAEANISKSNEVVNET